MIASLLDTNLILDDYYEKRENHEKFQKFLSNFKYGELNYTLNILTECIDKISKVLAEFSSILNNAITARHRNEKPWDQLNAQNRKEILERIISSIKTNPQKYENDAPVLVQLFEVLSKYIETWSEPEVRELYTSTIPNLVSAFVNYLHGRFSKVDPYSPSTDSELKEKTENIQSALTQVFVKPYDSNDKKITYDILMLILWGTDNGLTFSGVTFYTNDKDFLKNLKNLQSNYMGNSNPKSICARERIRFFNPYEESYRGAETSEI